MSFKSTSPSSETACLPSSASAGNGSTLAREESSPRKPESEASRDRVLIDRICHGDPSAAGELVTHYQKRLYATAYRVLRSHEDAEEIAQDALVRALRGLPEFRGESSFSTWVYKIALNLARNRYWHGWRRKRYVTVSFDAAVGVENETTWRDLLAEEGDSPADTAENRDLQERIHAGMERLSEHQREILVLRNIAHASYEEIARRLALSLGTVKSRIARARERLRLLSLTDASDTVSRAERAPLPRMRGCAQ